MPYALCPYARPARTEKKKRSAAAAAAAAARYQTLWLPVASVGKECDFAYSRFETTSRVLSGLVVPDFVPLVAGDGGGGAFLATLWGLRRLACMRDIDYSVLAYSVLIFIGVSPSL